MSGLGAALMVPALGQHYTSSLALTPDVFSMAACAFSTYRKLRPGYAGAAYRVRRASDSTQQDIGFAGDYVDLAALNTFCAGSIGYLVTWYDQSGNGRNVTQATAGSQPIVRNAGGPVLGSSGTPSASYDGIDDSLYRADAAGVSGTTAFTSANCSESAWAVFGDILSWGTDGGGQIQVARNGGRNSTQSNYSSGTQSYNTLPSGDRLSHGYHILQRPTGGSVASTTWEQNGSACAVTTVVPVSAVVSLGNTDFRIGAYVNAAFNPLAMKCSCVAQFASQLAGPDLNALRAELLLHAPTVAATPFMTLVAALGANLRHFWKPDVGQVILSGANVGTLVDAVVSANMALYSGSPVWQATSGPNGTPCINLSSSDALMFADGVSIATGHRVGMYLVGQSSLTANTITCGARATDGPTGSARGFLSGNNAAGKFRAYCAFTGGVQDIPTTAAADASWHLFASRPLATGASATRDGAEHLPSFTGTDTCLEIETIQIGHASLAAGKAAMLLAVDLSTNAAAIDAAIITYVQSVFALTIVPSPMELVAVADRNAWYRADQGITLSSGRISSWANLWGNGNLVQATGGNQPLFEAAGLGSQPCSYDDDGVRKLLATLTSAAPIGSRVYIWMYAQLVTVAASKYLMSFADAAAVVRLSVYTQASTWNMARDEGAIFDTPTLPADDSTAHLFEIGYTASAANYAIISGVQAGPAATSMGTNSTAMDRLGVHTNAAGSASSAVCRVAEIVISLSEPSAAVKTAMRAYFAARYGAI